MTVAEFRARGPEFANAQTPRVQAALDAATRRTDATVFGASTDDAIFYLAAHLLAASPTGKDARLKGEGFESVYLAERRRLESEYAPLLATVLGASSGVCTW